MVIKLEDTDKVKFMYSDLSMHGTTLFTPEEWRVQLLTPKLKDNAVPRHLHSGSTELSKTQGHSEAWICLSGTCNFSVYDIEGNEVFSDVLRPMFVLAVELGGNGINDASEDFRMLEIKQGPYRGNKVQYF